MKSSRLAALAGSAALLAVVSACGEPSARPMDDEFAGNSGETGAPTQSSTTQSSSSCCEDVEYHDGQFAAIGQYGPVGEDSIDVYVNLEDGIIQDVRVEGHPFTSISENHQTNFAQAIPGVVTGKPIAQLSVDTVAGASWTSQAFNAALDEIRRQASSSAAQ